MQLSNIQTLRQAQGNAFKLGLIGYPVSHSLSPKIQNASLKACRLEGEYSIYPVQPDDQKGLKDLLDRVRAGEITGFNVTIPHKQNVIPLLDELTLTAQAIGAVNTIYMRGNKLIGDNTDAPGFLADLKKFIAESPSPILGEGMEKSAIVLGAGGSARAVVYALLNDGWNVTIAARRPDQARQLAETFPSYHLSLADFQTFQLATFNLLVNTTPLGMTPKTDTSPLPEEIALLKDIMIYDLVYNPRETKLVKDARAQGCHAITGFGMLIEQAALSFEIWTGHNPLREVLYDAVSNL